MSTIGLSEPPLFLPLPTSNQGYGVLRTINVIQRVVMIWLNNRAPRLGEFLIQTATGNDSDTWAPTPLARLVLLSSGSMRNDA